MEGTITFDFLGITFGLNVAVSLLTTVIVIGLLCHWMTRNLSIANPGKPQLMLETLVDFVRGIVSDQLGASTQKVYVAISLTLFLFILVSNILGLPFLVEYHHQSLWKSPTADLAVCVAMSVLMNIISHILGMRRKGAFNYWKETYLSASLPIKVVEELINMLTLAMRLFGNIFAGEMLLSLIANMGNIFGLGTWFAGIPLQIIWQGFSVFIGAIQAYIFVTLSMVYLQEKVTIEEE